jgi:tRNA-dependent cyclodipeptide synthase
METPLDGGTLSAPPSIGRDAVPLIEEAPEPTPRPRYTRYRAKVDAVSPPSRRRTFEGHDRCFLGVSLENSNFVRPKLLGILEWIARRFRHCTVLVGDSIHRITLSTTSSLAPEAARATALALGHSFLEGEKACFERYAENTEFSFVTCAEVQTWPAYRRFHDRLSSLFATDEPFRASVESFGRRYHAKHGAGLSDSVREHRIRRSSDYFLEEFAVFACLRQRGIPVMVYPGSFSTLAEIAAGEHAGAPAELRDLVVVSLKLAGR